MQFNKLHHTAVHYINAEQCTIEAICIIAHSKLMQYRILLQYIIAV